MFLDVLFPDGAPVDLEGIIIAFAKNLSFSVCIYKKHLYFQFGSMIRSTYIVFELEQ